MKEDYVEAKWNADAKKDADATYSVVVIENKVVYSRHFFGNTYSCSRRINVFRNTVPSSRNNASGSIPLEHFQEHCSLFPGQLKLFGDFFLFLFPKVPGI